MSSFRHAQDYRQAFKEAQFPLLLEPIQSPSSSLSYYSVDFTHSILNRYYNYYTMFGKAFILALLPLGALSFPSPKSNSGSSDGGNGRGNGDSKGGQVGSGQQPFSFPLANGFPNITIPSDTLTAIQLQAHGTLPNTPLPTSIADTSAVVFSLIAYNEIFEVAFFTSLINNITNDVPGFEVSEQDRSIVLKALVAIQAQEELHALGANAILSTAGRPPIQPCKYVFPSYDLNSAIAFAKTFTDVVLGTLQEALFLFGLDGDIEFLELIGSVIGQEGEQTGFFRLFEDLIPSELPFLTQAAGIFAYSALNQNVVVPNSCPSIDNSSIPLPILGKLTVDTPVDNTTTKIEFSFNSNGKQYDSSNLHLVYVNQQNAPIVEPISNLKDDHNTVTFTAPFPYSQNLLNGLTIAAVTNSAGPFANASAVAAASLFGPGLIEVN